MLPVKRLSWSDFRETARRWNGKKIGWVLQVGLTLLKT